MGIWIELGVFILALAFGLWQMRDVKKAIAERQQAQKEAPDTADGGKKDEGSA